jgi:hypothetical protein
MSASPSPEPACAPASPDSAEARARERIRAFGVTFGPSIALDVAAGAAVAATIRALVRGRRPPAAAGIGSAMLAAYLAVARPWLRTWGATAEEAGNPLPGDDLMPNPGAQSTRAVTVDAPVADVWPWLAQIGQDRAGFYSYEWLENLAGCRMHNARELHPEWQSRTVGETVYLHPRLGLPVARFEPGRMLALQDWGAFVVAPAGAGHTRLIARGRTQRGAATILNALLMEVPHFVMERKMLLGIKRRAENGPAGCSH